MFSKTYSASRRPGGAVVHVLTRGAIAGVPFEDVSLLRPRPGRGPFCVRGDEFDWGPGADLRAAKLLASSLLIDSVRRMEGVAEALEPFARQVLLTMPSGGFTLTPEFIHTWLVERGRGKAEGGMKEQDQEQPAPARPPRRWLRLWEVALAVVWRRRVQNR